MSSRSRVISVIGPGMGTRERREPPWIHGDIYDGEGNLVHPSNKRRAKPRSSSKASSSKRKPAATLHITL